MNLMTETIRDLTSRLCETLGALPDEERIDAINVVREAIHEVSPMKGEPVDLVLWVASDRVRANSYNPNAVAPPEMRLLERSVEADGYTQPIVSMPDGEGFETVDGFHRSRVGKENPRIRARVRGRLPVVRIRPERADGSDRMASTVRHNRARGAHDVSLMVGIVAELVEAGMSDVWILKNIGMDADELLRLKQISGIAALFKDREFSRSWAPVEGGA